MHFRLLLATAGLALTLTSHPVGAQVAPASPAPHHASPAPPAGYPAPQVGHNEVRVLHQPSDWHPWQDVPVQRTPRASSDIPTELPPSQVEVVSSMPPVNPGQPPSFAALDTDGDGRITSQEASGYPLLANDFLYVSQNKRWISPERYAWWLTQW